MRGSRPFRSVVIVTAIVAIITAGMSLKSPRVQAQSGTDDDTDSRIQRGFEIAPVPLNLEGKNRALVGLGSYLVNAAASCNITQIANVHTVVTGRNVCRKIDGVIRATEAKLSVSTDRTVVTALMTLPLLEAINTVLTQLDLMK